MAEEKIDPKDFHYKSVFEFVDKFLVTMYPTTDNRMKTSRGLPPGGTTPR